jgi:hypothetical protein
MLSNKIVSSNQINLNSGGVVLGDAINYAQNIGHARTVRWALISRPLKNAPFCPIPALGSNFNLRNTRCMSVVKIFACLGLAPRLNVKEFTGQAKLNIFQRSHGQDAGYSSEASVFVPVSGFAAS